MSAAMPIPAVAAMPLTGDGHTYSPALDRTVKMLVVLIVTIVTCMEFWTNYAVAIALPDIQGDLAASFDEGSWVLTTYTTCFLVGLVLSNWAADRIGYRRYMIMAVVLFMLSAIGCACSHTLAEMLVYRGVMGFAGGNFLVRGQTAIYRTYVGKPRIQALAFFAISIVVGARMTSYGVGGYLTEWYSWRYVFLLNVPLSLAALVLLICFAPDFKAKHAVLQKIDLAGLLLLVGWLAPIQIVLSRGERDDWFADPVIFGLTVLAATCLPLFVWWETRPANTSPIVNLRLYRMRNYVIGSIYIVILGMMLYGQMYLVPQFLRNVQHHSSWGTAKLQTVNAAAFAAGLIIGGLLMLKIGVRTSLAVGAGTFLAGMYLWASRMTVDMPDAAMILPLALTGFGAGWQVPPSSTLMNKSTPNVLMGDGMEMYFCKRLLGGSWGIAVLTILVDRQRSFWSSRLGEHLNDYSLAAQDALREGTVRFQGLGLPSQSADAGAAALVHGRLMLQSTVNALADTFWYQAALGLMAILLVICFQHGRRVKNLFQWVVDLVG